MPPLPPSTVLSDPFEGETALPSRLHRRNRYRAHPPNFTDLATRYPEFAQRTRISSSGRATIDFQDPLSVRELTLTLLKADFNLALDIPRHTLCPMIPNRLDYIHVIEDLVGTGSSHIEQRSMIGLDIGTGASCIYPLLACRLNPHWKFIATGKYIHKPSISVARQNVANNGLSSKIQVLENPDPTTVLNSLILDSVDRDTQIDFCMCNPPFYGSSDEISELRDNKALPPFAVCEGQPHEMITPGGEALFVIQMITESLRWTTRIKWYTSLLGKYSSLEKVIEVLNTNKIHNYGFTEICQGSTRRWILIWSFSGQRLLIKVGPAQL
ncbi:ribosomal RNA large subunit methyltransferase F-like protein [Dimargaris cristalligena]|uniref:U6 small nuclear RNA (adenine-(43)-N(6))-methyltransferase n=1 Tax=Dimargaris cristalligena TaxID=215637 RepID=A0A4P9ZUJ5_9FUNG|nr:ribosomal RNA large subunit methyltransferase F-like protein [Dimargaris cristalligena]|eukprot:RKP37223.1 ribosomal RNA large subunit methyltransferase F-like protein [Dimargaris cristalligena]